MPSQDYCAKAFGRILRQCTQTLAICKRAESKKPAICMAGFLLRQELPSAAELIEK
ncbi:hypothetical protein F01_140245 [Burkholderia cenocepacia]|nr:hypothetical protein F01_140245 [Burkholderia cenocepacia]